MKSLILVLLLMFNGVSSADVVFPPTPTSPPEIQNPQPAPAPTSKPPSTTTKVIVGVVLAVWFFGMVTFFGGKIRKQGV